MQLHILMPQRAYKTTSWNPSAFSFFAGKGYVWLQGNRPDQRMPHTITPLRPKLVAGLGRNYSNIIRKPSRRITATKCSGNRGGVSEL